MNEINNLNNFKQMKKILWIFIAVLTIISACNSPKTEENKTTNNIDTTVYSVKTIVIEKQQIAKSINYTANLIAFEEINYAPASPGRIEEIYVEVGDRISKGSTIARMDKTQLIQAEEQYMNAKSNFLRMDTLYKLNSVPKQQYEAVKTQYEVAKSSYEFLSKNTTLTSPINGVVTGKYFENGELYSGAPNTTSGKAAIVTIMQINPLKAVINLSEKFYTLVKNGMQANVKVDIFPDRDFKAQVYKIHPTINSSTRTFEVELTVNNSDEKLRPGMFARVDMGLGETEAFVVPAITVVKQEGTNNYFVFKANDDNTADKILIDLGTRYDDKIEIISDKIKEGDKIIFAGQNNLLNGSKIKIVQ